MYNIIIISENRGLLKKIWEILKDQQQLAIHLVPFSTDAVDTFYIKHADLVILDISVLLPYQEIIAAFKTAPWNFGIIILSNKKNIEQDKQIIQFPLAKVNKTTLVHLLDELIIYRIPQIQKEIEFSIDWLDIKKIILPYDTYHVLWIKSFIVKMHNHDLQKLKDKLLKRCQLQIIKKTATEALILIKRSEIQQRINFNQVRQVVTELWGQSSLFVYEKNIAWQNIEQELQHLKKARKFSFFLSGQTLSLPIVTAKYSVSLVRAIDEQSIALTKALFNGDLSGARQLLQDIYLHLIKQSDSFIILEYVRLNIRLYLRLNTTLHTKISRQGFNSIENEVSGFLDDEMLEKSITYRSDALKETLTKCVSVIWLHFREGWSLERIAEELAINKIYLNRIFKDQFQYTILEVVNWLRLEMAKVKLCYSEDTVAKIAVELGFRDVSYFGRFFKKACKDSPNSYRKKVQKSLEDLHYENSLASK